MNRITDSMWNEIKDLIPNKISKVGRPLFSSRKTLEGVFYVLKTGTQWKMLPRKFGAPSTIHGKFRYWIKIGVFKKIMDRSRFLYEKSFDKPRTWFAIDASYSKAPLSSEFGGRNPTDRGRQGIKKNIIVDIKGAPLAVSIGPANRHDSKFFEQTFELLGSYNKNIAKIIAADSAYDDEKLRVLCKKNNFVLLAATNIRRNKNKKKYKPACRWIVERTFGWLAWFRGLKICWAKTLSSYLAFLLLASSCYLMKMGGF